MSVAEALESNSRFLVQCRLKTLNGNGPEEAEEKRKDNLLVGGFQKISKGNQAVWRGPVADRCESGAYQRLSLASVSIALGRYHEELLLFHKARAVGR